MENVGTVSMSSLPTNSTGGFLNPIPKDFGMRINKVDGGYLINNFSGGMFVRVSVDEARAFVLAAFDEAFAPKETKSDNEKTNAGRESGEAGSPEPEL